jgi:peptide subunit release factor 1 (eRF1)
MNRVLIDNSTNKPIVDRIIVAGAAELKFDISDNATLDFRLKDIFLPPITIEYGGNRGLENAIERSQGVVGD